MESHAKRKHPNTDHILTIGSEFLFVCRQALHGCRQLLLRSGFQNHDVAGKALSVDRWNRCQFDPTSNSNYQVLVIEVNTIPGMTPSTVLIHQALAEEPPMYPREFFRTVLDLALQRSNRLLRASAVESED
ncbi:hypothetical protein Taro_043531 [Colocasia esculenta]|uniref:Uncharacterized protein n=1 Tax=Colocasia esculenta TaxID=4460 RepID=A0A843WSC4_COLES|nr:hypothetical protein [Colocasia esculenta]